MKTGKFCAIMFFCIFICTLSALYSKESYEDYQGNRIYEDYQGARYEDYLGKRDYYRNYYKNNSDNKDKPPNDYDNPHIDYDSKDKPLSEINTGDFMDELKESVNEEIDTAMSKERQARYKRVGNRSKLLQDVRKLVRKEIESAIRLKQKVFISKGIIEIGGFFNLQTTAIEGSDKDNDFLVKFYPSFSYYFLPSLGINVRLGIDANVTHNIQQYYGLLGPQFVFAMDIRGQFLFFTTFLVGVTYKTDLPKEPLGYRFGNDLGVKFIFSMGFSINVGLMIAFDNAGETVSGFQDIFMPTIGITGWF